jgi:PEP-CTERM motif
MRKLLLAATALALASPVAAFAAPTINVVGGVPALNIGVPGFNNFKTELGAAGFTKYTTNANLVLTGMAKITYYYMGSESGFKNTFSAGGAVTYTENSRGYENFFGAPFSASGPILIGSKNYAGGSLAGLLSFSSSDAGAAAGGLASDAFGIFLKGTQTTGYTTLYFGYDDELRGPDDNHDDYIVKAVITALPVPEPGTWAMLLSGFAIVGSLLRRRRSNGVTILA